MDSMKTRSRWFQFNLRFALFVTLATAALSYWCRQNELERQALIAEVESLGGKVIVERSGWTPSFPRAQVTDVILPYDSAATLDLDRLRLFPALTRVRYTNVEFENDLVAFSSSEICFDVDGMNVSLNEFRPSESR